MINIILKYNYFKDINDEWFHQIHGIAMGTPIAPLIANMYMYQLEKTLFNAPYTPLLYLRYIDDILMIWDRDNEHFVNDWLDGVRSKHLPSNLLPKPVQTKSIS